MSPELPAPQRGPQRALGSSAAAAALVQTLVVVLVLVLVLRAGSVRHCRERGNVPDADERHGERDERRGAECVEDLGTGERAGRTLVSKHERRLPLQTHESRLVSAREEREPRQERERHYLVHPHPCCPMLLPSFRCRQSLL